MKFLVCNFILLIGYFSFIAENEVINDFKKNQSKNIPKEKKLTYESYNQNKVPVSDHVEKDIKQLDNYRKDMLQKVDYIQKTFTSSEGVRKIAQKFKFSPEKDKAIDPEFLEELKRKYSKKNK